MSRPVISVVDADGNVLFRGRVPRRGLDEEQEAARLLVAWPAAVEAVVEDQDVELVRVERGE